MEQDVAVHDLRNKAYKQLNDMVLYVELETEEKDINISERVIITVQGKDAKYIVSDKVNNNYKLIFLEYC